jgi:hypothetical protein
MDEQSNAPDGHDLWTGRRAEEDGAREEVGDTCAAAGKPAAAGKETEEMQRRWRRQRLRAGEDGVSSGDGGFH